MVCIKLERWGGNCGNCETFVENKHIALEICKEMLENMSEKRSDGNRNQNFLYKERSSHILTHVSGKT